MRNFNWKLFYALKDKHEELYGGMVIPSKPGIYKWIRQKENGLICEYIGQAKNLYDRHFHYYCIQSGLRPFKKPRPIELSLIKHRDWEFQVLEVCNEEDLDVKEKFYIEKSKKQPNTQNYNVVYGASETTRKTKEAKWLDIYKKHLSKNLKNVNVIYDKNDINKGITITYKHNLDGKINKKSFKCLSELIQEINNLLTTLGGK